MQVCWSVDEAKVWNRESRALLKASEELRCKKLICLHNGAKQIRKASWHHWRGEIELLPLREWLQAYSREANDLAQALFALYVSVAITAATRHRAHLAADAFARRYNGVLRFRLARLGALLVLIPWSVFVGYAAWPSVVQSVLQLERFPETFTPGYFIVRLALLLLALLTLAQGVVDVLRARPEAGR